MRRYFSALAAALAVLAVGRPAFALASPMAPLTSPLTARQLESLDRLSDPQLSPDGRQVVYDLRTVDFEANTVHHAAWLLDVEKPGGRPRRLNALADGDDSPRWSRDGRWLYFLSGRGGSRQVWRADPAGGAAIQVTRLPLDIDTFRLSANGARLVVSMAVFPDAEDPALTRARLEALAERKAEGKLYQRLFTRHWDTWTDGRRNHLFALRRDAEGGFTGAAIPLMAGFEGDTPSQPFGDDGDYAVTPDGTAVVFSARKDGRDEAWNTNFDLWIAPTDGGAPPRDLTPDNPAADTRPTLSPDGATLAWEAQKRPGAESDHQAVWIMNLATGARREADPGVDLTADELAWSSDGRSLLITAARNQQNPLFSIDVATGAVRALTQDGSISSPQSAGGVLLYARNTFETPDQLWVSRDGAPARQVTDIAANVLAGARMSRAEPFAFAGWNRETVHGFVFKPTDYGPGKTYPTVLILHGGPEASLSNAWTYRWNPQVWAGWGFAVVTIDYHGSTGYGQAFTDSIVGHWGDRPLEDIRNGWAAAMGQFPFIDPKRACAAGASFGGYMVYWLASQWKAPWKCLIAHDGVFDTRALGLTTDELWFTLREFGDAPWSDPEAYERFNPARFAGTWTTPMLVIHSARDFRVSIDQGLGAFATLQRLNLPSQFLTFPNENHWVLKPQDSVQWHETVEAWLRRWTG